MNDIQKKLMDKIKNGEVTMVPRWHFILRSIMWGAALVITAMVAIYLLSFVLFFLHKTGVIFAPLFGWSGLMLFVVSSPWLLIGVLGLFILALYFLVSHYSFSYQKPLIYSMVGVVLLVIAVSSLIHQTNFHDRAGKFMQEHEVPGFAPLYHNIDERPTKDVVVGYIEEGTEDGFIMTTMSEDTFTVHVDTRTRLPKGRGFSVGDKVMVFGPQQGGDIKAFGVRFDNGELLPPQPDQPLPR